VSAALQVLAPVAGRAVDLGQVPDPIFAERIVGPGAAIDPPRGVVDVVAPVSGKLLKVFPHAFVVLADDGGGVLVHLGIDTVELAGEGFTLHVKQSDQVSAGDVVVTYDVPAIEATGRNPVVPVILLEQKAENIVLADAVASNAEIRAGEVFLTLNR
jgi:glucose-specific phosphotransferase system IIA component